MTYNLQYKRGGTVKYFVVVRDTYNEIKQEYEIEAVDILEAAGRVKKKNLSHKGYLIQPTR
jgi:hypothetical protein